MVFGIYCRKSVLTDKGESVENQLEMCRSYIYEKFGRDNEIIVYEDEGYSGKNTLRPMFTRLSEDIRLRKLDFVVCYRLDRMSRSVSDFSALVEMMNRCKTGLICIKEEFDTSKPMGKAMMYIASVFSQLERETIGERVRDNMLMLAKDGRWLGGNTPYGYTSVREPYEGPDGRRKFLCRLKETNELELPKKIYDIYLESESLSETALRINSAGFGTQTGRAFTPQAIRDIIANPVYCEADRAAFEYFKAIGIPIWGEPSVYGLTAYNKGDKAGTVLAVGRHAPAVSGQMWTKAQRLLKKGGDGLRRGEALASGEIICESCGGRFYAVKRSRGRGFDYICGNKRKKRGCTAKNLNGIKADEEIKKYLTNTNDLFNMKKEVRERLRITRTNDSLIIERL